MNRQKSYKQPCVTPFILFKAVTGQFQKPDCVKLLDNAYFEAVNAIIPISLKRIAIARMQAVERGTLSRQDAERSIKKICKLSKSDITAHLTEQYDRQVAEAFQFFRLI